MYRLQIDIESRDDALALAELIREMGYEVNTFANTANRQPIEETRAAKILLAAMKPGRCYQIADMAEALEEANYSAQSAAPLLSALRKKGIVKRIGVGSYCLTSL